MSLTYSQFALNREQYGHASSWAIWDIGAPETSRFRPDSEVPDFHLNRAVVKLNRLRGQEDLDRLGYTLNPNMVLVALNFAERDEQTQQAIAGLKYHAFHEETTLTSDQRLRDACCGTALWGGYITDLVKIQDGRVAPLRHSASQPVARLLRTPDFVTEQVLGLIREVQALGAENPVFVALGGEVYRALSRKDSTRLLAGSLGSATRIVKVTHYSRAAGIRHHDYVARVYRELHEQGLMFSSAALSRAFP